MDGGSTEARTTIANTGKWYSTARGPRFQGRSRICHCPRGRLVHSEKQKKHISVWEQLIRLQTFDRINRKNLIIDLERIICKQTRLRSICLEGLSLTPDEGVRLLLALHNSRKTIKHVYCWRAFEKMVGLTVDTVHHFKSEFYGNKRIKKSDWFRAIGCLEFLTTLSINYAYIATPTGDLLVCLAKKLRTNWHWLQLLCLEEEILQRTEDGGYVEKVVIPDRAWKAAHFWAPVLKEYQSTIFTKNFLRNTLQFILLHYRRVSIWDFDNHGISIARLKHFVHGMQIL